MNNTFPQLFSPVKIGGLTLKNRIFIPGHGTRYARDYGVGDDLIAYHEARAAGGVGLIVTEVCSVHHTYDPPNRISLTRDDRIPGIRRLTDMCHGYDCRIDDAAVPSRTGTRAVSRRQPGQWPMHLRRSLTRNIDTSPFPCPRIWCGSLSRHTAMRRCGETCQRGRCRWGRGDRQYGLSGGAISQPTVESSPR